MSDVDMEGYSAARLWQYGKSVGWGLASLGLQQHAVEEAKHSRIFSKILFELFPYLATKELVGKLDSCSPRIDSSEIVSSTSWEAGPNFEEVLNSMLLVNLYEIKALYLEHLLRPVVTAYANETSITKLDRMMALLIRDEINHIRYSAEIINIACQNGYRSYCEQALSEFTSTLDRVVEAELDGEDDKLSFTFNMGVST
jgi:hypothetical protein